MHQVRVDFKETSVYKEHTDNDRERGSSTQSVSCCRSKLRSPQSSGINQKDQLEINTSTGEKPIESF